MNKFLSLFSFIQVMYIYAFLVCVPVYVLICLHISLLYLVGGFELELFYFLSLCSQQLCLDRLGVKERYFCCLGVRTRGMPLCLVE